METLCIRQRWMALPWGAFGLALALFFGALGVYSLTLYPEEEPSVRVAIPMYVLALYWVFALLLNKRTAAVTPDGIRVSIWPFMVRFPRQVKYEHIRHCYIRQVDVYDDGTVLERYYSAGIETLGGEQVDLSSPHNTADEAIHVADRIARVLNQRPGRTPVQVRQVKQLPERREILWTLLLAGFWLALFIASIFVGFEWEEKRLRSQRATNHPFDSQRLQR